MIFGNLITESLVIPSKIEFVAGGVNNMVFLTMKMFSPAPSTKAH